QEHEDDDHQAEHAREGAPGSAANQGSAPPRSNFKGRTFCSIRLHFSFLQHTTCCLYRLPKVISEMVGQTCRFAATIRRSSPTISEISFGNHSNQQPLASHLTWNRRPLAEVKSRFSVETSPACRRPSSSSSSRTCPS